jgi:hypothetical protein
MTQKRLIITDNALEQSGRSPANATWISRRLYWSEAGAMNWLAVVNEPKYPLRDPSNFNLRDSYLEALSNHRVRTLVSLGPGDGRLDFELVHALRRSHLNDASDLKYIPVDISRRLLDEAIAIVQAEAAIPVGVCCDFEDGIGFLAKTLGVHTERPVLFALLGGTVGNLDNGEEPFFNGMRRVISRDDAFLIDFPLAGPAWDVAGEPRLKVEEYSPTFRRFLAEGACLAGGSDTSAASATGTWNTFAGWAVFAHEQDTITGAEVITVADQRTGRRVLVFRRYHWEPLLRYLEGRGFAIEFARSSIVSEKDRFGMGVVLLTAPKPLELT